MSKVSQVGFHLTDNKRLLLRAPEIHLGESGNAVKVDHGMTIGNNETLDAYKEPEFTGYWGNIFTAATETALLRIVRVGKKCTLIIGGFNGTANATDEAELQNADGTPFLLDAEYIPIFNLYFPVITEVNGTWQVGHVIINGTTGGIKVYPTADPTSTFTNAQTAQCRTINCTYRVQA